MNSRTLRLYHLVFPSALYQVECDVAGWVSERVYYLNDFSWCVAPIAAAMDSKAIFQVGNVCLVRSGDSSLMSSMMSFDLSCCINDAGRA